jgi:hypothetical protein
MGLTTFCKIFLTFGMNDGVFHKILSVPENIVMDLNNVMRMVYHKEDCFMITTPSCDTSSELATYVD